ncbi:MAG: hypothetical protein Q9167_001588 [Letrouitia subvulpina]
MDPSSASFLANALGQIKTSASNATSNFSTSNLLMAVPRILARAGSFAFIIFPEQIDGMLGYQNSGSVIAEATGEGAPTINALLQSDVPSQEVTAAWTSDPFTMVNGSNSSSLHQSWSFSHIRNFGGIFTYVTSKWAIACLTLAIVLNRTKIYASGRRNLSPNLPTRIVLRSIPLTFLLSHVKSLLRAIRCQTSPSYPLFKYGDGHKHLDFDFSGDGGLLYGLSKTLLFWENDKESCLAVNMVRRSPGTSFQGSSLFLWPLFLSFCLSQFIETFFYAVQGRTPMTETGMSVFEHSLAFAEAETMFGSHLGLALFENQTIDELSNATAAASGFDITRWIARQTLYEKLNVPPEVLLMGLISCLNNLSSHALGMLNLQERYRLLNTGIWGLCYMSSFVWGFLSLSPSRRANAIILRFPTVCIVGFIPHIVILCGILCCCFIYFLALLLAVFSPPVGLPRPSSWSQRFQLAFDNLQANVQLSTIRINMREDFYSVLLKIGFSTLTMASDAVYLHEGRRIRVHRWTWLEEKCLQEIQDAREFAKERVDAELTPAIAGGIALSENRPSDRRMRWQSGYAREKTTKSLKPVPGTSAGTEAGGIGALRRTSRFMGAWEFLTGIFWLVYGWYTLIAVKMLHRTGGSLPSWSLSMLRFGKTTELKKEVGDTPSTKQPKHLEFWMLSNDGVLSLPQNDQVDVEVETKKRLRMAADSWGDNEEQRLDSTLYGWWKHGGWWGELDTSGSYQDRDIEDDLTSEISTTTDHSMAPEWEDEDDNFQGGCTTPTQRNPFPSHRDRSRESSPFLDHALDSSHLARLLDPKTQDDKEEARVLSSHLTHSGILTRSLYKHSQSSRRTDILTSSRFARPPSFYPGGGDRKLTPQEEAEVLEYLILSKRNTRNPQLPEDASVGASNGGGAGAGESWLNGGEGMGAGGPQCVVCQRSALQ